jgi:ribosomal protein S19
MSVNLKKFKYVSWEISHIVWSRDILKKQKKKVIKLWNRRSYSDPFGIVKYYGVYKGNKWIGIRNSKIKNKFKVSEFAFNRKPFYCPPTKKNKK